MRTHLGTLVVTLRIGPCRTCSFHPQRVAARISKLNSLPFGVTATDCRLALVPHLSFTDSVHLKRRLCVFHPCFGVRQPFLANMQCRDWQLADDPAKLEIRFVGN